MGAEAGPRRSARRRLVRGRSEVTAENLAEHAEIDDPVAAEDLRMLWEAGREESRDHARRLRLAARFHAGRLDEVVSDAAMDEADCADMAVATALRITTAQAHRLIRDGSVATARFPAVLSRLEAADLPVTWFQHLLRAARDLSASGCALVDEQVGTWELDRISVARFRREVRLLIAWAAAHDEDGADQEPERARDVRLADACPRTGVATLEIAGPVPEILSLSRRLDAGARAVQQAQRAALANGVPVPFDVDGLAAEQGRAMSLRALRYAILTRSVLDTGAVEVPAERFRLNVTVPMMTLLGASSAPATIDGEQPVPAAMARALAAGEPVWHRILTDPATGIFLPAAADSYRPSAAMREHLRLRHPVCAAPGCTRGTRSAAEIDHIEEFDHADPGAGGLTELENLHMLCWRHHQVKTARRIDPERVPPRKAEGGADVLVGERDDGLASARGAPERPPSRGHGGRRRSEPTSTSDSGPSMPPEQNAGPGRTKWRIGDLLTTEIEDNRDLVTPLHARALLSCWRGYRTTRREREMRRRDAGVTGSPQSTGDPQSSRKQNGGSNRASRWGDQRPSWGDQGPAPF